MNTRSLLFIASASLADFPMIWMARENDAAACVALLLILTHTVLALLIHTSTLQSSSGTAITMKSSWDKDTPLDSSFINGTRPWIEEVRSDGVQSLHSSRDFFILVYVSDTMPHSFGQVDPPKDSHRAMRKIRLVTACVIV